MCVLFKEQRPWDQSPGLESWLRFYKLCNRRSWYLPRSSSMSSCSHLPATVSFVCLWLTATLFSQELFLAKCEPFHYPLGRPATTGQLARGTEASALVSNGTSSGGAVHPPELLLEAGCIRSPAENNPCSVLSPLLPSFPPLSKFELSHPVALLPQHPCFWPSGWRGPEIDTPPHAST